MKIRILEIIKKLIFGNRVKSRENGSATANDKVDESCGNNRHYAGKARKPRHHKPDYKVLPKGTVFLVDGANLLGAFDVKEAAQVLESTAKGLMDMGYGCQVYLEYRSWKYQVCNQRSEFACKAFKNSCKRLGVTIVKQESDLAILQTLRAMPNTVALTNDRYSDYEKTFPKLVGTTRLRGFSVTGIKGEKLIIVDGLAKAIKIGRPKSEKVKIRNQGNGETVVRSAETSLEPFLVESVFPARSYTRNIERGLRGHGKVLLQKGNLPGAIHCFEKMVAKHDVEGCVGLTEAYKSQGDTNKAEKFEVLAERLAHRMRDQERRCLRMATEMHRRGARNGYMKSA